MNGVNNLVFEFCPFTFLSNHRCTVFKYSKERLPITFAIRTAYFAIDCESTVRLTSRGVKECRVDTGNDLIVFAGMICFSGSGLLGQSLKPPLFTLVIVVACFNRNSVNTEIGYRNEGTLLVIVFIIVNDFLLSNSGSQSLFDFRYHSRSRRQ